MATIPQSDGNEHVFPSTSWEWKLCKVKPAPAGDRVPKGLRSTGRVRDRWKPQTIQITYRGGPESSWLVQLGSYYRRVPGYLAIEDVMTYVLGGNQGL